MSEKGGNGMNRTEVVYELRDGNRLVYVGKTKDPIRRKKEHQANKEFTKLVVISPKLTAAGANKKEEERIKIYMRNHHGDTPKYNQNATGK